MIIVEIKKVDLAKVTEEDLLKIIGYNIRATKMMESRIKELKNIGKQASEKLDDMKKDGTVEDDTDLREISYNKDSKKLDTGFEDEVNYYLTEISCILEDSLEEKLESCLPSRNHYRYKDIILRLKLESLKNIKEIKEFLAIEAGNISKEDMIEFKDEILLEQKKINLLTSIADLKDDKKEEQVVENRFVFATRSGGNIRVLEEIDRIPSECYSSFKGLFDSIKNGTFRDVKRLNSNPELVGFCEVRDLSANTRVVFDRVDENTYVLITAFIKKSDTCDNGYMYGLKNKINIYKNEASQIKENLGNSDFMDLQQEYEAELYRKLGSDKKEKGTNKVKKL